MRNQHETDNNRITAAIEFLIKNYQEQPRLKDIARHVSLSQHHFHRMFQQWVGVTPKQFAMYLSVEHAKQVLKETHATLFDAACEVGLSTTSRLHDLFVNIEGMTPGEYKNGGESLTINYSFGHTPFGRIIIGSTEKGICHLTFTDGHEQEALERLKDTFPNAAYRQVSDKNQQAAISVFNGDWNDINKIKLHLKGTEFQLKVWQALLHVPSGGLATYSDLAVKIGSDGAQRAVGTAMGANPVMFLIPCHRVIRGSGIIGNYRYGTERKIAMIGWEAAKR